MNLKRAGQPTLRADGMIPLPEADSYRSHAETVPGIPADEILRSLRGILRVSPETLPAAVPESRSLAVCRGIDLSVPGNSAARGSEIRPVSREILPDAREIPLETGLEIPLGTDLLIRRGTARERGG